MADSNHREVRVGAIVLQCHCRTPSTPLAPGVRPRRGCDQPDWYISLEKRAFIQRRTPSGNRGASPFVAHRPNCPKVATPLELARYQAKREAGDGGTRLTQAARTDCPRHLDRAEHIGGADAQAGGPLPSSSPPKESVPSATTRASLLPLAPSNRRVHAERQGCSEGSTTKCSDCAKRLR